MRDLCGEEREDFMGDLVITMALFAIEYQSEFGAEKPNFRVYVYPIYTLSCPG